MDDLKFIHITKTGGTSIENVGSKHSLKWGRYDNGYLNKFQRRKYKNKSVWHVPLRYFKENPYNNKILFTVVRNPYTRCISEFYCPWGGKSNPNDCSKEKFNKWIQTKLSEKGNDHFLPQYIYIYSKGMKIVKHILYFEKLKKDFNKLMKKYNINCILNQKDNRARDIKKFQVKDFDKKTIKMINKKYSKDFKYFNYEKLCYHRL